MLVNDYAHFIFPGTDSHDVRLFRAPQYIEHHDGSTDDTHPVRPSVVRLCVNRHYPIDATMAHSSSVGVPPSVRPSATRPPTRPTDRGCRTDVFRASLQISTAEPNHASRRINWKCDTAPFIRHSTTYTTTLLIPRTDCSISIAAYSNVHVFIGIVDGN